MPAISALSGNLGLQASANTIRGLGTGHIPSSKYCSNITKEVSNNFNFICHAITLEERAKDYAASLYCENEYFVASPTENNRQHYIREIYLILTVMQL